ncbi:MAG: nucleotide sugar dehydrogenase [Candidatus Omnitrophota bacterium]|nr:nucleotide sugar dehydrogenase [Candidatus Omnitrophota bacterium]
MARLKIAIIGFGRIGQALAAGMLARPLDVVAVDRSNDLVRSFKEGSFTSSEPGVKQALLRAFRAGRLTVSKDIAAVSQCRGVLVAIPLLVSSSRRILDRPVLKCMRDLAPHLSRGAVVAIETTVPVGFCRQQILPALEGSRKHHGRDFFLVHSPERIKSGTMLKQLRSNPKIVAGIDARASRKGAWLYRRFMRPAQIRMVPSLETAEMVKLAGMVYRDVNIALANELAKYSEQNGIAITDVVRHANTDGEAALLEAGVGVGGHCTPVYPYFLIEGFKKSGLRFRLAERSRLINDGMAEHIAARLKELGIRKTLLLGLGFRPGVREDSFSPSYLLQKALKKRGIGVCLHDPLYTPEDIRKKNFLSHDDVYRQTPEALILVTGHSEYRRLRWKQLRRAGCKLFVDGRNIMDSSKIEKAGITYLGIGKCQQPS